MITQAIANSAKRRGAGFVRFKVGEVAAGPRVGVFGEDKASRFRRTHRFIDERQKNGTPFLAQCAPLVASLRHALKTARYRPRNRARGCDCCYIRTPIGGWQSWILETTDSETHGCEKMQERATSFNPKRVQPNNKLFPELPGVAASPRIRNPRETVQRSPGIERVHALGVEIADGWREYFSGAVRRL